MDPLAPVVVVALLAIVAWIVVAPLRRGEATIESEDASRRADLEAAKEAKYREIRDAELDYRTGKLSEQDWRALDRELRQEAMQILKALDALG